MCLTACRAAVEREFGKLKTSCRLNSPAALVP